MKTLLILLCAGFIPCAGLSAQERSTAPVNVEASIAKLGKPDTHREAVQELRNKGYTAFKSLKALAKNAKKGRDARVGAVLLAGEIVKASTAATAADREGFRKDAENMLAGDKDDFVREACAIALGKLGDKKALNSLRAALNDKSGNVRMRAAWALAKNGDTSGKNLALNGLKSKIVTEQILAVDALEELNDATVLPQIRENLESENAWVRINSALAVKRIEFKRIGETKGVDYLEDALHDAQIEVRQWAGKALAEKISANKDDRAKALAALKKVAGNAGSPAAQQAVKQLRILKKDFKITQEELDE